MATNLLSFSSLLRDALIDAWAGFCQSRPAESPYAFAVIIGQSGYLGNAIATDVGLAEMVAWYVKRGYSYQGPGQETCDNPERLAAWLRWANPDDGWRLGGFDERFRVGQALYELETSGAFGEGTEGLEEFCVDVLAALAASNAWRKEPPACQVVLGATYGEDPRDFLRTATRCNPYPLVKKLWAQYAEAEHLSHHVRRQAR